MTDKAIEGKPGARFGLRHVGSAVVAGVIVATGLSLLEGAVTSDAAHRMVKAAREVQVAGVAAVYAPEPMGLDAPTGATLAVARLRSMGTLGGESEAGEDWRVVAPSGEWGYPDVYAPLRTTVDVAACRSAQEDDPVMVACVADTASDAPGSAYMHYRGAVAPR